MTPNIRRQSCCQLFPVDEMNQEANGLPAPRLTVSIAVSRLQMTTNSALSLTAIDPEQTIEFEFVRATENAAINAVHWLGRGEKELADAAACDAINGVLDLVDICGEVVIGEGIKDNAPGIFLGDRLGTWKEGSRIRS